MQQFLNPASDQWPQILQRPLLDTSQLESAVQGILEEVQQNGDAALKAYTKRFDGVALDQLQANEAEFAAAEQQRTRIQNWRTT